MDTIVGGALGILLGLGLIVVYYRWRNGCWF